MACLIENVPLGCISYATVPACTCSAYDYYCCPIIKTWTEWLKKKVQVWTQTRMYSQPRSLLVTLSWAKKRKYTPTYNTYILLSSTTYMLFAFACSDPSVPRLSTRETSKDRNAGADFDTKYDIFSDGSISKQVNVCRKEGETWNANFLAFCQHRFRSSCCWVCVSDNENKTWYEKAKENKIGPSRGPN